MQRHVTKAYAALLTPEFVTPRSEGGTWGTARAVDTLCRDVGEDVCEYERLTFSFVRARQNSYIR